MGVCLGPASAVALSKSIMNRSVDLSLETVFALVRKLNQFVMR